MIEVSKLNKTYDRRSRHANQVLHDISFSLPDTGFVCILGPSGCGKTSLLSAIGGLDQFDSGTLTAGQSSANRYGTAVYEAERNRSFGYVFQNYYLLPDHSAAYNVYLGLHSLDLSHREKLRRVRQALQAVEMERYFHRTVGELSGGQQQRIAIARALARKPRVIFADEPTGNLDEANTQNICQLLRQISKTSLVVMVTHEERIAGFFADRIITMENGRIRSDKDSWDRTHLRSGGDSVLYAGDYHETHLEAEGLQIRFLRNPDGPPLALTLVSDGDSITVKLDDPRPASCSASTQAPQLREGSRPTLSLEKLDSTPLESELLTAQNAPQTRAGAGLTMPMLLRESVHLQRRKGLLQIGLRLFLVLLAVLTVFTVSDYMTLATLDPEDFITSDSHILEIDIAQGTTMYENGRNFTPVVASYLEYLRTSGQDIQFVPHISISAEYSQDLFLQLDTISIKLRNFSYVPVSALQEKDLIFGRMPQNSEEVVVDRWVLEKALAQDGILQNGISDISYFLGKSLTYAKRNFAPTIVGISDSGEPAVYLSKAGMISVGNNGVAVTPLSELRAKHPGEFDELVLEQGQCLVVANNAGMVYYNRIGETYSTSGRHSFTIVNTIKADVCGSIIVDDAFLDDILWSMSHEHFHLYCRDKDAVKAFLSQKGSDIEKAGYGIITVTDRYSDTYEQYRAASTMKADARTIVTFSVILVSMVMLYLLQRARTRERIGMLAVYRLLGIPRGKLVIIFTLETLLVSLTAALPAVLLTWGYIHLAGRIPELESQLILPFGLAMAVYGALLVYHLLVSLLPLLRLLRLPPAQLAAKYDI